MEKIKKISIGHILFLVLAFGMIALVVFFPTRKDENPMYEPAPPEAPRLTAMGVAGEEIEFSPEVRYYEIKLPSGNPAVPLVWATTANGVEINVYQAFFSKASTEASARIYLNDGKFQNSYEIKFVKTASKGVVLQFDDRYTFIPAYTLNEGEAFTFSVEGEGKNIEVDATGTIRAIAVSDIPSTVNAYVGEKLVDSMTVTKTLKAVLDVFVVAGQGNAAGEGGNADESTKPLAGTAYTVELDDRTNKMVDLSEGRQGFAPALAEKWYSLTSEKTLFIQTAVSDVSVTKWTTDGEAYQMAAARIDYFTEMLNAEDSPYALNKVFCIWLQGEWDIAQGMSSEEYITFFSEFYNNLKTLTMIEMTAIIPVRSSLSTAEVSQQIEPVCAAQYMLGGMYDDVRVITRLSETASIENGFISDGNLYYTQFGYNSLGGDVAYNLYSCYSPETDKSARKIELFSNTHDCLFEYGETVQIKKDEKLRTVAVVTPLYADKTKINVTYDETLLTYSDGGLISIAESNSSLETSEICFECDGMEFKLNIGFIDDSANASAERTSYTWEFNDINEKNSANNLTLSERSASAQYILQDGMLVSNDRQVDFVFEKAIELTSDSNWDIEWSGQLNDNGIILGGDYNTKGYLYLAPFAQNMGYSVRMVDNEGQTFYLPYEEYAENNRQLNTWRINYTKESKTLTLYANGIVVSKVEPDKPFVFTFTNLFGRYGSENVNYCYTGTLDKLTVSFN